MLHWKTLLNKFFLRQLFLLTGGSFTDLVLWTFTHQGRWVPVRAPQTVPQCEVLAIVVLKEQVVVGVVGGAIDDTGQSGGHAVVAIVDWNGPDVDKNVEGQVQNLMEGEEEWVEVVREAL